jgi:hypothetical protein
VSSGYNIQTLTFASSLPGITNPNGANTITNKNIEVHNQLIMDVDVTFRNCKFKIFSSEIAILDESKVNLDRCELFSCNGMWDGIYLETESSLSTFLTQIEDAGVAITADENAPMRLIGTKFNRNIIGIENSAGSGASGGLVFTFLTGNRFSATSPLNNGALSGDIGIKLHGTAATIGSFNRFINQRIGVESENSDVKIQQCFFEDIIRAGVKTEDGTMFINNCSFNNCYEEGAVSAQETNLTVTNSRIGGAYFVGINSYMNQYAEEVYIANNRIEMADETNFLGIALARSVATDAGIEAHNIIEGNEIGMIAQDNAEDLFVGIYVTDEFGNIIENDDDMLIEDNIIDIPSTGSFLKGILVDGGSVDGYKIRGNKIDFTGIASATGATYRGGIHFFGSGPVGADHTVSGNMIEGRRIESFFNMNTSIFMDVNPNTILCQNTTTNAINGFHFEGDCNNSIFSNNDINRHGDGLLITDNSQGGGFGRISIQTRQNNFWTGDPADYDDNAAHHAGLLPSFSQFIIETGTDPEKFPSPITANSSGWFDIIFGSVNECSIEQAPPGVDSWENIVLQDFPNYSLSDVLRFNERFKMAEKILNSSEFAAIDEVGDFIDGNNSKPFYNLATAQQMMRTANAISASQQLTLDDIQQNKQQILQELTALEANQPAYSESVPPPTEMDADYAAAKANLLTQLKTLSAERQVLTDAINSQRIAEMDGVKSFITNIAVEKEYEKSLKKLFLAATQFKTGEITAAQYQTELEQIMALSPEDAGIAYRYISGRGLNLCNESTSFESLQSIGLISENPTIVAEKLLLHPNPAKEELQITFPASFTGNLLLMDLTGKVVWQENGLLKNRTFNLSLGNLSNGIYVLSGIDTENNTSYQQKVVVQK